MNHTEVVATFFVCYQCHEYQGMHRVLHPDVEFTDLAFRNISGDRVRWMWRWFCVPFGERKAPVSVPSFAILEADGDRVLAHYRVTYRPDERHCVNYIIQSEFTLRDGKIFRQRDTPTISKSELGSMLGFPKSLAIHVPPLFRMAAGRKLDAFIKEPDKPAASRSAARA